jgi:hypothetical protein
MRSVPGHDNVIMVWPPICLHRLSASGPWPEVSDMGPTRLERDLLTGERFCQHLATLAALAAAGFDIRPTEPAGSQPRNAHFAAGPPARHQYVAAQYQRACLKLKALR